MGAHLIEGEFQSDKYPTTPRGKVPLSVQDKAAQDILWEYAQRRRSVDAEFSDDLEAALRLAGYEPKVSQLPPWPEANPSVWYMPVGRDAYNLLAHALKRPVTQGPACPYCGAALSAARECKGCHFTAAHEHRTCSGCKAKFTSRPPV